MTTGDLDSSSLQRRGRVEPGQDPELALVQVFEHDPSVEALPPGFVPWANADDDPGAEWAISRSEARALLARLAKAEKAIRAARDELGVPDEGYPAPVASAWKILDAALRG
jgi:hypothetical protein